MEQGKGRCIMSGLYRTAEGNLVLYAQEEKIYVRTLVKENAGRAVVLASDYASDLTDVLYRGTVYYAYKNTEGELLVRNIADHGVWYHLGAEGGPEGYRPHLTVLGEQLILFYGVKNPLDGQYGLRCQFPGADRDDLHSDCRQILQKWGALGTELPSLQVIHCGKEILFVLDSERMLWWSVEGGWTAVSKSSSLAGQTAEQRMEELRRSTQKHVENCLAQAKQQWEREAQQEQAGWEEQYRTELRQKDLLIESIKQQYEELMQVAQKYREEAMKWRSKFV